MKASIWRRLFQIFLNKEPQELQMIKEKVKYMNITVEKTLKKPLLFVANESLFVSQDIFNLRGR